MGFGRGKVILFGEHAVVHGYPAIAAGIERGVEATAREANRDRLTLAPWEVTVEPDAEGEPLSRAFAVALSGYPDRPALELEAQVGLPAGAGLGCSAAIGVAILDAIDDTLGVQRSREELATSALEWEKVFHGNPSGVDNVMSALGGVALFRKGEPLEPLHANKPLHLVIGYSGQSASTKEMVSSVARQLEAEPARVTKAFAAMEVLVRNGRLALEAGDQVALGQLLDLNHTLLNSLMLCTTRLDNMCQTARAAGALGAKMTGGGGGGCMLALAPTPEVAQSIRGALGDRAFVAEVCS